MGVVGVQARVLHVRLVGNRRDESKKIQFACLNVQLWRALQRRSAKTATGASPGLGLAGAKRATYHVNPPLTESLACGLPQRIGRPGS